MILQSGILSMDAINADELAFQELSSDAATDLRIAGHGIRWRLGVPGTFVGALSACGQGTCQAESVPTTIYKCSNGNLAHVFWIPVHLYVLSIFSDPVYSH